jgi:hypothetical protein
MLIVLQDFTSFEAEFHAATCTTSPHQISHYLSARSIVMAGPVASRSSAPGQVIQRPAIEVAGFAFDEAPDEEGLPLAFTPSVPTNLLAY